MSRAGPLAFIRRHPLPSYCALAFGISWGGVLMVVGVGGIPGTAQQFEVLLPAVVLAMLATGLIVGLLWGAWHLLVTWWGSGASIGAVPLAVYLPALLISCLPPYRVLMVWVHERTGSLLVAMLMHASLTASVRIFDPLAISGMPLLAYNLVLGAVLWLVVAAVRALSSGAMNEPPHGSRAHDA